MENQLIAAEPEVGRQSGAVVCRERLAGLLTYYLMESPELWLRADAKVHANAGATTRGVDPVTMDGFAMERIENIITLLKENRYCFKPARRVYIPKSNGKSRPLGVPSGDDKLVQEVVRGLLERIYEPVFSPTTLTDSVPSDRAIPR